MTKGLSDIFMVGRPRQPRLEYTKAENGTWWVRIWTLSSYVRPGYPAMLDKTAWLPMEQGLDPSQFAPVLKKQKMQARIGERGAIK